MGGETARKKGVNKTKGDRQKCSRTKKERTKPDKEMRGNTEKKEVTHKGWVRADPGNASGNRTNKGKANQENRPQTSRKDGKGTQKGKKRLIKKTGVEKTVTQKGKRGLG